MNANLSLMDNLMKVNDRVGEMEEILGKGLNEPFNVSNSGARKILYATQSDHVVPLKYPETPLVQTGYEIRFGDLSASIIKAEEDFTVEIIVPKFSFAPKHNFTVILRDDNRKRLLVENRVSYEHTTECYGYMYNTTRMDRMFEGSKVKKDDVIRCSTSYDNYGNRQDGINALVAYIGTDMNMEDSAIISESAAIKFTTFMIKKVTIILNDNNIPLNIHGNPSVYKCIPDVTEHINGGILFASRLEKKEESTYSQSFDRLNKLMISDEKFTIEGRVEDIEIFSNNPEILKSSFYNSQLNMYYEEHIRYCNSIVSRVGDLRKAYPDYTLGYELQKLYYNCKKILDGGQYIRDGKVFSNTVIVVTVVEEAPLRIGDKISDRYGGKGVISFIYPDNIMPLTDLNERIEVILNPAGCPNRENMGQLFETTLTHSGSHLMSAIRTGAEQRIIDVDEAIMLVYNYLNCIVPDEAAELYHYMMRLDVHEKEIFMETMIEATNPYISTRPITDNLDIDKIAELYRQFPWIKQAFIQVSIEDSNGNMRSVPSRRPIVCGRKYMHRLKQFAEEKFSVTSLSSVNIRNQNTKSKSSKNYKARFTNTPVNMGDMETGDLLHMGVEYVVADLMLHSVSPQARRLCEKMLTGDPIDVNIQLDDNSYNRSVEMVNTYLKAKGLELSFTKIRKVKKPLIRFNLIKFDQSRPLVTLCDNIDRVKKNNDRLYNVALMRSKQLITQDLVVFTENLLPSIRETYAEIDQYYIDKAQGILDKEIANSIIDGEDY